MSHLEITLDFYCCLFFFYMFDLLRIIDKYFGCYACNKLTTEFLLSCFYITELPLNSCGVTSQGSYEIIQQYESNN